MSRLTGNLSHDWPAVMLSNYGTPTLELDHGAGSYVWDTTGQRYLDLLGGIAVSAIGHCHPTWQAAIVDQASKLGHVSNLYAHRPGLALADKLLELADSDGRILFTQDGATANEAALKIARRHGWAQDPSGGKLRVVATEGGFHGRTFGALAVTGNPAKRDPFGPYGIDVVFVPFGDAAALAAAVDDSVCAVITEPVQGEAGVIVPGEDWLTTARAACDRHNALLIVDEVQSGIGRTGYWFASIAAGVRPDVITLAKGLAGGLPLGAVLVEPKAVNLLGPGDHGTTFGGNPISCRAALAVISVIESDGLLERVRQLGRDVPGQLMALKHPELKAVRGVGAWWALQLRSDKAQAATDSARRHGFLVNAVRPDAIRLAPPLNISDEELSTFIAAVPAILVDA